ncbi:MAG: DUF3078 domain-containing protein [Bacteroidota bacterium]|nr:DUF3078 domain-containing protein [Bacteroidota bacterium]
MKVNVLILISLTIAISMPCFAASDSLPVTDTINKGKWTHGGEGTLNVNQGYLSNWVEGGESSISATWILNLSAKYKSENTSWDNYARWKYGVLKSGYESLRKNEDKFEFESKFGLNASEKWYYSGLVNVKSQLFNGYRYPNDSTPVSTFLSPGNIVSSLGMDYKPNKNLTLMLSPFSVKTTVVWDTVNIDQTHYGLEADQRFKGELGGYITAKWKANLHENIVMNNEIELFSSYLNNPKNIDVDWEFILILKATKYLSTSISTHLIYDHDIDIPVYTLENGERVRDGDKITKAIQFKEMLSIGFSYKF